MDLKSEFNQVNMNDSYQLENDNSNGYHPLNNNNNNNYSIDTSPKRSVSPSACAGDRNRSRSRSYDRRSNNNNRRSYSRSRSPRNRNQDYSNDRSRRNDSNRSRNTNGGGSRYTDRELGLKYRWEKTVFVSNIPYEIKWPELKDLFKSKIGEIHFCEVFEKDNKSLGVGTIEFKLLEDAEKAVELMNQYDMGTRKISVRMDTDGSRTRKYKEMSKDFSSRQSSNYDQNQQQQSQQTANLLSAINSTSLLAALGLGNTGQQPVSPTQASSAQSLNTQSILSLLTQLGSSSNSNMNNNNNSSPILLNQLAQQNKIEGPVTNRIFVASLDYKVDEYKIREVFSLAGTVLNVSLFKDRDGKSRGMSVIEYTSPTQALNAVLMFNNQVLNNRTMNVRFDTKPPGKDDDGYQQQSSSKLPSGLKSIGLGLGIPNKTPEMPVNPLVSGLDALTALTAGLNNGSNSNSLSALAGLAGLANGAGNLGGLTNLLGSFNSNASKPASMSKISKIFIKNIPFSWDERKLKEKFRQAGQIDFVEIKHRDGKSRGCGLIKFSSPDQATKAVELFNGSRFEGRTLEVKLDQLDK